MNNRDYNRKPNLAHGFDLIRSHWRHYSLWALATDTESVSFEDRQGVYSMDLVDLVGRGLPLTHLPAICIRLTYDRVLRHGILLVEWSAYDRLNDRFLILIPRDRNLMG